MAVDARCPKPTTPMTSQHILAEQPSAPSMSPRLTRLPCAAIRPPSPGGWRPQAPAILKAAPSLQVILNGMTPANRSKKSIPSDTPAPSATILLRRSLCHADLLAANRLGCALYQRHLRFQHRRVDQSDQ